MKEDNKKTYEKQETKTNDTEQQKEQFVRLQAEFANYKRRTEEEKRIVYDMGASDVLTGVVEALDDFELALKNSKEETEFKKGMELIYAKLVSAGEHYGLERIRTVGEKFNPECHEALLAVESNKETQTILEEMQSGYKVKGKVIRTAKVKVSK